MILLLFTTSYPYDVATEQTFLSEEVKYLAAKFERVVLVPKFSNGNRLPVPNGVEVDTSFSASYSFGNRLFASFISLFSLYFYQDIREQWPKSVSISYLRRLLSFLAGAHLTKRWVQNWLNSQNVKDTSAMFYTYWFDEVAMGIGLAKDIYPGLRVISRAHGYDLYEELYASWPCRRKAISLLDGLFTDSDAGKEYLLGKYPAFSEKYGVALLGVPGASEISKPSIDGTLRIVSCSILNPVKRINLLFDGIISAAKERSELKVEWIHYGDGPDREEYLRRIENEFPPNAKGYFPGYSTQADLIQSYINNPVDIFVNVSETEGTPVSIMEAISCGIPILATAVGGNVEIASERNGFLLNPNPTVEEIAELLLEICDNPALMRQKRLGSRDIWQERYSAEKNFKSFAELLTAIRRK